MTTSERLVPNERSVRVEGRRRLLIGSAGLFSMLLLVAVASWLTTAARREAEVAKAQAAAAGVPAATPDAVTTESGPLADLGVTPTLDPGEAAAPAAPAPDTPAPQVRGGNIVVPDLQPDPELARPKRAQ